MANKNSVVGVEGTISDTPSPSVARPTDYINSLRSLLAKKGISAKGKLPELIARLEENGIEVPPKTGVGSVKASKGTEKVTAPQVQPETVLEPATEAQLNVKKRGGSSSTTVSKPRRSRKTLSFGLSTIDHKIRALKDELAALEAMKSNSAEASAILAEAFARVEKLGFDIPKNLRGFLKGLKSEAAKAENANIAFELPPPGLI